MVWLYYRLYSFLKQTFLFSHQQPEFLSLVHKNIYTCTAYEFKKSRDNFYTDTGTCLYAGAKVAEATR